MPQVDLQNPSPALLKKLNETLFKQDWRMNNLYSIQTKNMTLEKFALNDAQREIKMETEGHGRIMHLKARQLGISTYWLIKELDEIIWTPHSTCAVIANDRDTMELLFEIIARAFKNIPPVKIGDQVWLPPQPERDTVRMLKFNETDSKIYVDLSVRGGTLHRLHISEAAFIPNMNDVWTAVENAVPVQGGRIVVESTANGKGNWFYNQWSSLETPWKKMFFPWFGDKNYRLDVPKNGPMWKYSTSVVENSLTQEERQMMAAYGLDIQQICWYRYKMDGYDESEKHKMRQENPSNADEAFIYASGRFYPEFSRNIHVVPDLPDGPPSGVNKFAALDYGWSNPTCIGLYFTDYDGNVIKYKEAYKSFWPISEQCKWLQSEGFNRVNFADPSMHNRTQVNRQTGQVEAIADEYKRHGIVLGRANNDKGAGIPRMRDYLRVRAKHKNPFTGQLNAPHFFVCEGCVNTIREFEDVRYAKPKGASAMDQTAQEDHEKTEKISHALDETRYIIVSRPKLPEEEEAIIPNTPRARIKAMEQRTSRVATY